MDYEIDGFAALHDRDRESSFNMEYNICGKIAQLRLTRPEDLKMNVDSLQPVLDGECQMATVKQENNDEIDVGQQGVGLAFIKEEVLDIQDAEGCSGEVEEEPPCKQMSTSSCAAGHGSGAKFVGQNFLNNGNSISGYKCAETTVHVRKIKIYSCGRCSYKTTKFRNLKAHLGTHRR